MTRKCFLLCIDGNSGEEIKCGVHIKFKTVEMFKGKCQFLLQKKVNALVPFKVYYRFHRINLLSS